MKKEFIVFAFLTISITTLAQNERSINVGDTLYYQGNSLVEEKTSVFAIYKGQNDYGKRIDIYKLDTKEDRYWLASKSTTKSVEKLRKNGKDVQYHKNGTRRSEGMYENGSKRGEWKFYFKKGAIKITREYVQKGKLTVNRIIDAWDFEGNKTVINGTGYFYKYDFDDDTYIQQGMLENSRKVGEWEGTMEYGKYYEETYKDGTLVKGISWDKNGKKYKYKDLEVRAEYKGGQIGLRKFLAKNMNIVIPKKDGYEDKRHRHFIQFTVKTDGKISNMKIRVRGERNPYVIQEIRRVFNLMKPWNPGKLRGQLVSTKFTLPLTVRY